MRQGGISALRRVWFLTVVVWCDDLCSATALAARLLGDNWLCATCCWLSCLIPHTLHVWKVFLEMFCVPSLVHVATAAHLLPCSPSSFSVAVALLDVLIELAPNLPKLDLSASLCSSWTRSCLVLQHELSPRRGRPPAKRSPRTRRCQGSPTCGARSYHSIGGLLAMIMCHPYQFFALCDVNLEHERDSQATC